MATIVYPDGYSEFINAITLRRRELQKWIVLIIQINNDHTPMDEVLQALRFRFQNEESFVLTNETQRRVFVLAPAIDRCSINSIEKSIAEAFTENDVQVIMSIPLNRSMEVLCKTLGSCVSPGDNSANISLKRLIRPTNSFLVLSDKQLIHNQSLRMLEGFGHVAISQSLDDFFPLYRDYAPNAVFIDSDLDHQGDGASLVRSLRQTYDPFSHVVIIGHAATSTIVNRYKQEGINGFILPPFSYDTISRQMARVPTTISRSNSART